MFQENHPSLFEYSFFSVQVDVLPHYSCVSVFLDASSIIFYFLCDQPQLTAGFTHQPLVSSHMTFCDNYWNHHGLWNSESLDKTENDLIR